MCFSVLQDLSSITFFYLSNLQLPENMHSIYFQSLAACFEQLCTMSLDGGS